MAKSKTLAIVSWITATLVSLAVAFGMISLTLVIPFIPDTVTQIAGWIVVIGTIISIIMAIID
jgi:hypothetical protein